ncbi:MAG: spermidine/putrescine transport system permease protein [Clostridiales bacterium]|nr:spermidine/putrescine transport system permease protein [Clostridiales bacterium]
MVGRIVKRVYLYLIFLFLYAPIVMLVVYSFNESRSMGRWSGFTLKWYAELFKDTEVLRALYNTLTIAVLSAVIATIIGTAAAIGIHEMKRIKKAIVMNLTYLPVINPDIVTGVSLMLLFVFTKPFTGMGLGFFTMLLAHITFNIPYVILSVMPKLKQLDRHVYEAALDLGATPFYALRKVVIPQIMPGIVTGLLLAFTLSIDDFVISFFTTGSGVSNIAIYVYSMARRGVNPKINALSTIMFVTVLALLLIVNKRMNKDNSKVKESVR